MDEDDKWHSALNARELIVVATRTEGLLDVGRLTLARAANILGISRGTVRQTEIRAMDKVTVRGFAALVE